MTERMPTMRPRRLTATATAAVALVAVGGGAALAAWTQSGTGSGATKAADLAAPGTPAVVGTPTSSSISLSWTGSLTPAGTAASYLVQRAPFGSASWASACAATHLTPSTLTACTDSGLTAGTDYQYRVLAALGSWRTESPTSARITTASAQVLAVPSTPDLTTDTGSSGTDNITSASRPTFTGTGTVGSTVTVYDGAVSIGSAVVGAGGTWSVTGPTSPAVLSDGVHSITARASLAALTSASSSALAVTVDTTAPAAASMSVGNATASLASNGTLNVGDFVRLTVGEALSGTPTGSATLTLTRPSTGSKKTEFAISVGGTALTTDGSTTNETGWIAEGTTATIAGSVSVSADGRSVTFTVTSATPTAGTMTAGTKATPSWVAGGTVTALVDVAGNKATGTGGGSNVGFF
jgi:hypothetical protein